MARYLFYFILFFYHDTALKLDHVDLDGVDNIFSVLTIAVIKHWHKSLRSYSIII